MFDSNWDLINGPTAHEIETLNQANQINVIEALVRLLIHHAPPDENGCPVQPNAEALCEIHRTGTLFLLEKPGSFREGPVYLTKDGALVYTPPAHTEIQNQLEAFFVQLANMWRDAQPIEVAAYAIWRINWIHPFKNGNGRCARAFAYACLCLKYGFILPGSPTILDLIMTSKSDFEIALNRSDQIYAENRIEDTTGMVEFLTPLLIKQLSSIPT